MGEGQQVKITCCPSDFLNPICGISVVKRKITAVFTAVISLVVDLKRFELSTSRMRTERSPN